MLSGLIMSIWGDIRHRSTCVMSDLGTGKSRTRFRSLAWSEDSRLKLCDKYREVYFAIYKG